MDLLISFDAHKIPDSKEASIEAYKEFYESLKDLCLSIIHPYNDDKIPRSTCFLKGIKTENLESFERNLRQIANSCELDLRKLLLLRLDDKEYQFKLP